MTRPWPPPRRRVLLLLVLPLLLLVGCSDPEPRPRTEAAPPPAADPVAAPPVPRFEPADCPFRPAADSATVREISCSFVVVPEDRAQPAGPTIRLAVAVFKGHGTASPGPPLIWLDGGPGGPSLDGIATHFAGPAARALLTGRDLVVFDQRGVGYSQPSLACDELTELKYTTLDLQLSRVDEVARAVAAAHACRARLAGAGVNLAAYTSAASAADVNDIRLALGYDRVSLYGVSYGTRLALTVLRDFPAIVHSAVLDSVVPLQASLYPDAFSNAQRAFDQFFAACAADPACEGAYPDLEGSFYALVDRLNASPLPLSLRHPRTGREHSVLLTGDRLVGSLFGLLYRTDLLPGLPRLLTQLRDGDPEPFGRAIRDRLFYDGVSHGMHYAVQCSEEAPFTSPAELRTAAAQVRPAIAAALDGGFGEDVILPICAAWGARPAAPVENQPVHSTVPILLLAGAFDPITPPAYAAQAATTLPNAVTVVVPAAGHGVALSGPCPFALLRAFLADPATRPNDSCLASLMSPAWILPGR